MSGEPWYPVAPLDVFPEEFASFLLGEPRVREAFMRHHADLLTAEFWQECQRRVAAGEVVDFFPYEEGMRFSRRQVPGGTAPSDGVLTVPPVGSPRDPGRTRVPDGPTSGTGA
jgi:isocitrate dehydrogenase kinase/phosphatase